MTGRIFVVIVTAVAYLIALRIPQSIFDVATQYAFAGYAALVPLLVAALFWKNSTRWGALASTLWTAAAVWRVAVIQTRFRRLRRERASSCGRSAIDASSREAPPAPSCSACCQSCR